MTPARRRSVRILIGTVAVAAGIGFVTGCSSSDSSSDSAAASSADGTSAAGCAAPSGQLIEAKSTDAGLTVAVPQPAGWDRQADFENPPVTLALANTGMATNDFSPNLVITESPGRGDAQAIFANELQQLRSQVPGVPDGTASTICGFEALTLTYEASGAEGVPVHPITSRMIVVPSGEAGASTVVVLTVQSLDADNPTYQADSAAMLDGVQITAPAPTSN